MSEISDIEELLSRYREETRRSKGKPAAWVLLTLLGTASGGGFSAHAYLSHLATQEQVAALEKHIQTLEDKLDRVQSAMAPSEVEQNLRISNAQSCCDRLSTVVANHLNPRRRTSE